MSITEIPTDELQSDLVDTEIDIQVCTMALEQGVERYGTGKSVAYRLTTNCLIRDQIKAELARREVAYA